LPPIIHIELEPEQVLEELLIADEFEEQEEVEESDH
jgi:hypothetical protein